MNGKVTNDSHIALMIEGYPRTGYQTYAQIIGTSSSGLCIGRLHPDYVAHKFGLERAKRYWLSSIKDEGAIAPKPVHNLVKIIRSELKGRAGSKVLLDGLEYLLLFNNIDKVLDALNEIDALLKQGDVTMFVLLDPLALEQNDLDRVISMYPSFTSEDLLNSELPMERTIEDVTMMAGSQFADL